MSTSLHVPGVAGRFAAHEGDERWALVLRVLNSRHLVKAQQLRDILLYICHCGLSEEVPVIREHTIACEVLGRRADFNPHEDNIVRVQISHLRKRLDEYFAGEGQAETLRLTIPKGSYVPRFETVVRPVLAVPAAAPVEPVGISAARPEVPNESRRLRWAAAMLSAALIVVSLAVAVAYRLWDRPVIGTKEASSTGHEGIAARFWAGMFRQPANLVVADTCLVMLQDILDADIRLDQYLNGRYPGELLRKAQTPALQAALKTIASRQYTSLADINTASDLMNLSRRNGSSEAHIRYARYLNVRDFKNGNFIMMGSRRGIPWVQLFEPQLNFSMEEDGLSKTYFFRNRHPRPGEQDSYRPKKDGESIVETYADVAVVPNLSGNGSVMMLSGIGMESSESAGELVTGPDFSKVLASLPADGPHTPPPYFELLLRTRAVGGAAKNSQVVTYRVIRPAEPSAP